VRVCILNVVAAPTPPLVVLDMPHTTFFGSAFIEILFKAWKRLHTRQGEFVLSGLTPYCHEVIQITNLDRLWKVVPTANEGLAALTKTA
jgi:anti-sigma B factor antagonist